MLRFYEVRTVKQNYVQKWVSGKNLMRKLSEIPFPEIKKTQETETQKPKILDKLMNK